MSFRALDDEGGTPASWIEFSDSGEIIDNSFLFIAKKPKMLFFATKSKELYRTVDKLSSLKGKLFLPESGNDDTLLDLFDECGKNTNFLEQFLVGRLRLTEVDPRPRMFDVLMRDYCQKNGGNLPPNLEEKWKDRCWFCASQAKENSSLMSCSNCKMAKYCGRNCQKSDWKRHKILHADHERVITKNPS